MKTVADDGATPKRSIRISDRVWDAAKQVAADEGRTVSDVIRERLEDYVDEHENI